MRRGVVAILLGVALIVLAGGGLWWAGVFGPRPMERRDREGAEPVQPELTLSVNGFTRITIPPGTPLVFKLMLRNGQAVRAAGAAEARERLKEELEEQVKGGELSRQEAEDVLKGEPLPAPVPPMGVTLRAEGFSFQREGPQGITSLPWRPKVVEPAAPTPATLDVMQTASATFVLAPEATISAARETYRVRVHFENRSTGQWQGQIASNPVVITIAEAPGAPTASEQKKQQLLRGEYFLALKDHEGALGAARQVLAIHPQSIDGSALLGKAQEAKGDYRAALEAYEKALEEFDRRQPDADHPPEILVQGIWRMRKQLGIEVPAR